MNYAVEMGSYAVMYKPSFIKTGSDIQKLIRVIHKQHEDHISLVYFLQKYFFILLLFLLLLSTACSSRSERVENLPYKNTKAVFTVILKRLGDYKETSTTLYQFL
jgi:hypothetical protein